MRKYSHLLLPGVVLVLALWARLAPWEHVFGGLHPALLGDSDANYHLLRAERWLLGAPGAPWRDPALNWPNGADIPWPPLFDALLAGAARAFGGAHVERDTLVTVAALVPVALGMIFVLLCAALGRRLLGRGAGWLSALVAAFTSFSVDPSRVGRTDQHILEMVLFAALLLATVPRSAPPLRTVRHGLLAALLVALAFWGWMGSAFHLLVLLALVATLHVLPRDAADPAATDHVATVLAIAGLGGALLLAASVAVWGRPGALGASITTGVGGLQIAMAAAAGTFAALLRLARRRWSDAGWEARLLAVGASAAIPGLLLLAIPSFRAGIAGGLAALTAGNAWYASIDEFRPLLGAVDRIFADELLMLVHGYGLVPFLLPIAAVALVRAWRDGSVSRAGLTSLAVLCATLIPLTLARKRFGVYTVVPLAICTELALLRVAPFFQVRLGLGEGEGRRRALALVAAVAVVSPSALEHGLADPVFPPDRVALLEWIARRGPASQGREAVLARWATGHAIQYFAGRPVVTSPFGTEGGAGAMEAAAAFWLADDPAQAEAALAARDVGLVLLGPVIPETALMQTFAPPGTAPAIDTRGDITGSAGWSPTERFWRLVPTRLYYDDGLPSPAGPALDGFRLLAETVPTSPDLPAAEDRWMLFEPVAGAKVHVRGARAAVRAEIEVETNLGRRLTWVTGAMPGSDGVATLRLPYASGANGAVRGREWRIGDGVAEARLVLHEEDVVEGRSLPLDLTAPSVRPSPR